MAAKGDAPLQVRAADSSTNFLMEHSNQELSRSCRTPTLETKTVDVDIDVWKNKIGI